MDQTLELWHAHRIVYVRHGGKITRNGVKRFLDTIQKYAGSTEIFSFLTDHRQLNTEAFTPEDINWIIQEIVTRRAKTPRRKHALLVSSPLAFGNARMFEMKSKGLVTHDLRVFDNWTACLQWLHIPETLEDPLSCEVTLR